MSMGPPRGKCLECGHDFDAARKSAREHIEAIVKMLDAKYTAKMLCELLSECEFYVTAYKCQVNPPRTREEASALLGEIRAALKTANAEVKGASQAERPL